MTRANLLLVICLVLVSLWLVTVRYESRRIVVAIEKTEKESAAIQSENRRLEVDKDALSRHSKVALDAYHRLGMALPGSTVFIEGETK
jgi:cell division protein FtsL